MSFQLCPMLGSYTPWRDVETQTLWAVFGSSESAHYELISAIFPLLRVKVDYFLISSPFFGAGEKRALSSKNSAILLIKSHSQVWGKVGEIMIPTLVV